MADFTSGVAKYITGMAIIKVHFPVDEKGRVGDTCEHCAYLSSNNRTCQLNKEPVFYYKTNIGHKCPLVFEFESEENL